VDVRITPKGQTFEALVRQADRALKSANRKLAGPVSRKGIKAIKAGAPRFGTPRKQLTAKTEVHTSGDGVVITFYGVSAGAWAINETGAKAHDIFPRQRPRNGGTRRKALAFAGAGRNGSGYAAVAHHKGIGARGLWTKAGERLEDAVGPAIEDVYDEAFR
jgi:hypothetical protein